MFWTPLKLALVAKRTRAWNRAITMEAKSLTGFGRPDLVQFLPARKSVAEVKASIADAATLKLIEGGDKQERKIANARFRRIVGYDSDKRTSEMTRILKKNNPLALELTSDRNGNPTTYYQLQESRYRHARDARERNRKRRNLEEPLYEGDTVADFGSMSAPEYRTAMDGNDLTLPDEGEWDDSYTDMPQETIDEWVEEDYQAEQARNEVGTKFRVYLSEWTDALNRHDEYPHYQDVIDALEWLYDNRPEVLQKMFDSGANEMDIAWVVDSGEGSANPFVNISFESRHNQSVAYILSHARSAGWNG